MAKNNDGLEAGKPVTLQDIMRVERDKRATVTKQVETPKPAPRKRVTKSEDSE